MANRIVIKPSHRGLFTKKAHAAGKSVHAFAEEEKHSPNETLRDEANFALNFNDHGYHGTVHAMRMHDNGTHMVLTVRHKKPKKDKHGFTKFESEHDSQVMVPLAKAGDYHVGQKVGAGVAPLGGGDADPDADAAMGGEPDQDPDDRYAAGDDAMMAIRTGKKKKRGSRAAS